MAHFIQATVADMKGGRESWRVLVTVSLPSSLIAVAFVALSRLH
ncbi:MAG: hypothetical protein WA208_15495 [Thermoanaerobaculia bacterium]